MACITLLSTWLLHNQIFRSFPFTILSFYRYLNFPLSFSTFLLFLLLALSTLISLAFILWLFIFLLMMIPLWWMCLLQSSFSLYITKSCFPGLGHLVNCLNVPFCSSFYALPFNSVLSLFSVFLLSSNKNPWEKYK